MRTAQEIQGLYEVYLESLCPGEVRLGYDEFLEQMLIATEEENRVLVDELCNYQNAADATHRHYLQERDRRENAETMVATISALINSDQVALLGHYLSGCEMWN